MAGIATFAALFPEQASRGYAGGNVLADQCLAVRLVSGGTMPAFGSRPICGVLGQQRQSRNRPTT
jgi:hypothetical protein